MKVGIACDFGGFGLKEAVKEHLSNLGHTVVDVGQTDPDVQMLYFDAGKNLAKGIQKGDFEKAIAICGSGGGISLICNKHKGVYCIACESLYTAANIGLVNNCNVLAMGGKMIGYAMGCEMAEAFLNGVWCEGFEEQRKINNQTGYAKLLEIEQSQ